MEDYTQERNPKKYRKAADFIHNSISINLNLPCHTHAVSLRGKKKRERVNSALLEDLPAYKFLDKFHDVSL